MINKILHLLIILIIMFVCAVNHYQLGLNNYNSGNYEKAREEWEKLNSSDKQNLMNNIEDAEAVENHHQTGNAAYQRGNLERALEEFEQVITYSLKSSYLKNSRLNSLNNDSRKIYRTIAIEKLNQKERDNFLEEVIVLAEKYLEVLPGDTYIERAKERALNKIMEAEVIIQQAEGLIRNKSYQKAREMLLEARIKYPKLKEEIDQKILIIDNILFNVQRDRYYKLSDLASISYNEGKTNKSKTNAEEALTLANKLTGVDTGRMRRLLILIEQTEQSKKVTEERKKELVLKRIVELTPFAIDNYFKGGSASGNIPNSYTGGIRGQATINRKGLYDLVATTPLYFETSIYRNWITNAKSKNMVSKITQMGERKLSGWERFQSNKFYIELLNRGHDNKYNASVFIYRSIEW